MLDHTRLFEPLNDRDGAAVADNQIGQNRVVADDTSDYFKLILNEYGPVILCSNCSVFVVFVFACIALTHSDNDLIYSACGHTLRNLLIADIMLPILFYLVAAVHMCTSVRVCGCCIGGNGSVNGELVVFSCVCCFVLIVCLGSYTLSESVYAVQNSNCTDAMRNTYDGMDSPSAGLGIPLLVVVGFIFGVLNLLIVAASLFGCVYAVVFSDPPNN
jgi:hypothetical protein